MHIIQYRVRVMVFNATFNNFFAISLRSVLLVEETGENRRPVASHWQTVLYRVYLDLAGYALITSVVVGTDYIGSCKSNWHTITTTTDPLCCIDNVLPRIPVMSYKPTSLFLSYIYLNYDCNTCCYHVMV